MRRWSLRADDLDAARRRRREEEEEEESSEAGRKGGGGDGKGGMLEQGELGITEEEERELAELMG